MESNQYTQPEDDLLAAVAAYGVPGQMKKVPKKENPNLTGNRIVSQTP
jgi:hypothetical protein